MTQDAAKFADDYAEMKARKNNGEMVMSIGKKKKFKRASVEYKASGAKAIFYRQLLEYKKEKWFFEAAKQIVRPNIIFLITCPAELAIRRIKNRAEECDRYLNEELLKKVREEFLRLGRRYDFQFIDTDREPTAAFGDVKKILEVSL